MNTVDNTVSWNPVKRLSHCSCHKLTGGHASEWFERLLMFLIPHFDIIKGVKSGCRVCRGCGFDRTGTTCEVCLGTGEGQYVALYLRRFYLFRSKWLGLNFGDLYLHHIVRSDDDPDPHDHPWGFTGLILSGGYTDQRWTWTEPSLSLNQCVSVMVDRQEYAVGDTRFVSEPGRRDGPFLEEVRPWSIIRRPAEHIHRVLVPKRKTAWTLIATKAYSRDWRFITETGPVPWRTFLGIPEGVDVGE